MGKEESEVSYDIVRETGKPERADPPFADDDIRRKVIEKLLPTKRRLRPSRTIGR